MNPDKKIEIYFLKRQKHKFILNKLRNILLKVNLVETIKWGMPTYTLENKNLIGIGAFKNHVGLWFFREPY